MFIDRAKIYLQAGKGGDGAISFRREKYVEFGGPDGGNGGKGGSIYFVSKDGLNTLSNYRHAIKVKADNGDNGHKKNSFGKSAEDVYLIVPTGTVIYDEDHNMLFDFNKPNMTYLACKGGKGGKGNKCFATPTNRAPKIAENGDQGEKKTLILELKLIADVGLVGLPSVGKSSFLSVVSNAKPKIAEYKFTTLEPMLGTVMLGDEDFVIADLPGLIEGASQGKGLGYVFLRHIERCRVIIHIVDVNYEESTPFLNFEKINNELYTYSPRLKQLPMVIALNKMDIEGSDKKAEEFKSQIVEKYPNKYKIFEISTLTKQGLNPLLRETLELVKSSKLSADYSLKENVQEREYIYKKEDDNAVKIYKLSDNHYEIIDSRIINYYHKINISNDEGMMKFMSFLNSMKIEEELEKMNAKNGSTVKIDDFEFVYTKD